MNPNLNNFMRDQVRVQKKFFFDLKFEFGKMFEFFRVRVQVRVRSSATGVICSSVTYDKG